MTNDEAPMTNDDEARMAEARRAFSFVIRHSAFVIDWSLGLGHWSFQCISPRYNAHRAPMGIYDRDYYRNDSRGAFGAPGLWSVTVWLVVVNVLVFVIDGVIARRSFAFEMGPIARWS